MQRAHLFISFMPIISWLNLLPFTEPTDAFLCSQASTTGLLGGEPFKFILHPWAYFHLYGTNYLAY